MSDAVRRAHDESADLYDRLAGEHGWYPEIIFGLCFPYISPGQRLLALGIGTGLCIEPFARFGLRVSGMDNSAPMLAQCRAKAVADELMERDLEQVPWPWPGGSFDHVLASGVFHFLGNLTAVVSEATRVVRDGGILAFTTKLPEPDDDGQSLGPSVVEDLGGVRVYAHRTSYLAELMVDAGLTVLKQAQVCVRRDLPGHRDVYVVHVTRRRSAAVRPQP